MKDEEAKGDMGTENSPGSIVPNPGGNLDLNPCVFISYRIQSI